LNGFRARYCTCVGPRQEPLGVCAVGLVGDLLGEVVALAEYLTDEGGDFLGVVIVLERPAFFGRYRRRRGTVCWGRSKDQPPNC
jgi:hypothetical protein